MRAKSNARRSVAARRVAARSSPNASRIGIPRLPVETSFGLLLAQRAYRTGETHRVERVATMAAQGLRVAGIAQRNAPRLRRFAHGASTRFGGSSSGRTTVS